LTSILRQNAIAYPKAIGTLYHPVFNGALSQGATLWLGREPSRSYLMALDREQRSLFNLALICPSIELTSSREQSVVLNHDQRGAGFTLLEALVALTILTGTMASLTTLVAVSRRAEAEADADLSATLHAQNILVRIGRDLPLEAGAQSGILEDGLVWSVLITPYRVEGSNRSESEADLFQVRVSLKRRIPEPTLIDVVSLRKPPG
jgi:hypothetical protein